MNFHRRILLITGEVDLLSQIAEVTKHSSHIPFNILLITSTLTPEIESFITN